MSIAKNLELSFQRLTPAISRVKLSGTRSPFDLNFTTEHSYSETDTPTSNRSFSTTHSNDHSVGLSQKIPFGTTFEASSNLDNTATRSNQFNDSYSHSIGLSATQPLLKNFGTKINLFNFRSAEYDILISDADYQTNIDQTVTEVANAFFELLFARENLKNRQLSLKFAQQLQQENQSRYEIGVMTKLDLSQANSEVASRQEAVFRSERDIRTRQNALKLLISDEFESLLNQEIIPISDPVFSKEPPALSQAFKNALTNRPDLLRIKKEAEKENIRLQFRDNQLWPQLDLSGSYGYNGLGGNPQRSIRDSAELDKDDWSVGIIMRIPFQNRSAKSQIEESKLLKEQKLLQIKQKEQSIMAEVDNALSQVLTNQKRVESAGVAEVFAKETLEAEQEKLTAGASTTFTVLRLQRDYTEAQTNALRTKADLEKSLAELHRVQGLSLIYAQETKKDPLIVNP